MAKKSFSFGMLAMTLTLGLFLAGCNTDTPTDGGTPTVTSVTVTAANNAAGVAKGGALQFTAAVAGENDPAQTVTWSITTAGVATGTAINTSGLLTVASGETQTSIEVRATSTVDTSKSGTKTVTVTGTQSNSIEMVSIPAGTFEMGQSGVATPVHSVTVSSFNMGKYEVTQAQYEAVMGTNPASGYGEGDNYPVYYVSWYEAIEFCNALSQQEGLTPAYTVDGGNVTVNWNASGYRLPTEAEWEYACRAGTTTAYNTGDTITSDMGWYSSNSGSTTHPVGGKPANDFGLYDMHGNVWEWCWDWYDSSYYGSSPSADPHGPVAGSHRVERGGSWGYSGGDLRSAFRDYYSPSGRSNSLGFRLVRP